MEMEMGGNELAYIANQQDLYPTSYLRQQVIILPSNKTSIPPPTSGSR
jgi:hypothetical protein